MKLNLKERFKGNPLLSMAMGGDTKSSDSQATSLGVYNKAEILLAITFVAALLTMTIVGPMTTTALVIGFIVVFVIQIILLLLVATSDDPDTVKYCAIAFAVTEGLTAGAFSALATLVIGYGGILSAFILTILSAFAINFCYKSGMIKVTEGLRSSVTAAIIVAILFMLVDTLLFPLIGIPSMILSGGWLALLWFVFMLVLSFGSLLIDYDDIAKVDATLTPKHKEWFLAVGVLISIVWIYVNIVRILIAINSIFND